MLTIADKYSILNASQVHISKGNTMTKFNLMRLLFSNGAIAWKFTSSGGTVYRGYLLSVQREDGSGSSFNVEIVDGDYKHHIFHLRTID